MLMHSLDGGCVKAGNIFAVALCITVEKMVRKEIDVFAPVSQRRDVDLDRIQAKQEVLTESASSGLRIDVGVRSRQHSNVDAPSGGRADTLEISRFQHTQKFCLQVKRNVGDFVQKQRAAISKFKSSDAVRARVGKGAFDVTEELAFKHTFR